MESTSEEESEEEEEEEPPKIVIAGMGEAEKMRRRFPGHVEVRLCRRRETTVDDGKCVWFWPGDIGPLYREVRGEEDEFLACNLLGYWNSFKVYDTISPGEWSLVSRREWVKVNRVLRYDSKLSKKLDPLKREKQRPSFYFDYYRQKSMKEREWREYMLSAFAKWIVCHRTFETLSGMISDGKKLLLLCPCERRKMIYSKEDAIEQYYGEYTKEGYINDKVWFASVLSVLMW